MELFSIKGPSALTQMLEPHWENKECAQRLRGTGQEKHEGHEEWGSSSLLPCTGGPRSGITLYSSSDILIYKLRMHWSIKLKTPQDITSRKPEELRRMNTHCMDIQWNIIYYKNRVNHWCTQLQGWVSQTLCGMTAAKPHRVILLIWSSRTKLEWWKSEQWLPLGVGGIDQKDTHGNLLKWWKSSTFFKCWLHKWLHLVKVLELFTLNLCLLLYANYTSFK